MARRPDPFDRRSMAQSVGVHLFLLVAAWLLSLAGPQAIELITYEIEMVSPPPATQAEVEQVATEQIVVETPDPTPPPPPEPEVDEAPVAIEDPEEAPPEPEQTQESQELAVEDETEATTTEAPAENATDSGEDINVRMEGLRRDFPAYYGNIVRQIQRCFRPPRDGRDWTTVVFFFIDRDGEVADLDFVSRSGSFDFDFSAMGAVECAGQGRFGPLPDDLPYDRLPIQFEFKPNGDPVGYFPVRGRPAEDTRDQ